MRERGEKGGGGGRTHARVVLQIMTPAKPDGLCVSEINTL